MEAHEAHNFWDKTYYYNYKIDEKATLSSLTSASTWKVFVWESRVFTVTSMISRVGSGVHWNKIEHLKLMISKILACMLVSSSRLIHTSPWLEPLCNVPLSHRSSRARRTRPIMSWCKCMRLVSRNSEFHDLCIRSHAMTTGVFWTNETSIWHTYKRAPKGSFSMKIRLCRGTSVTCQT